MCFLQIVIFTILGPKNTIEVVKIKYELVRSILIKPLNVSKSPPKVGEIFLLTVNLAKIFCELGQGRGFLTIVGV